MNRLSLRQIHFLNDSVPAVDPLTADGLLQLLLEIMMQRALGIEVIDGDRGARYQAGASPMMIGFTRACAACQPGRQASRSGRADTTL